WLRDPLRRAAAVRPGVPDALREPRAVDARLARLWWDAHVGGPAARALLVEPFGTEHLLPPTNFAGWASPPPGEVRASTDPDLDRRLDANARRFLRDRLP